MKIIKKGIPYKKHKCSRCKTVYIYQLGEDVFMGDIIYCPVCRNYLDFHMFDKRISKKEYLNLEKESDVK